MISPDVQVLLQHLSSVKWRRPSKIRSVQWAVKQIQLAMSELRTLYLSLSDSTISPNLFAGAEDIRSNLDSTLRFVRDLLSAATEAIRHEVRRNSRNAQRIVGQEHSPGAHYWMRLMKQAGCGGHPKDILEVANLLDDFFEDMVYLTSVLNRKRSKVRGLPWAEVYRLLNHFRDHYDYAERHIINTIKPAESVP